MTKPAQKRLTNLQFFVVVIGLLGGILSIIMGGAIDQQPARNSTVVTEVGICVDSSTYQPVTEVPAGTERFYLCGELDGSIPLQGSLYLFDADKGAPSIYQTDFKESPGIFFFELTGKKVLEPGRYSVQLLSVRTTMAEIEFSVN